MRIPCRAFGKPAFIVGYAPGRKGRPMAIVITEGGLKAIRLKDVELGDLPEELGLTGKVLKMKERPTADAAEHNRRRAT